MVVEGLQYPVLAYHANGLKAAIWDADSVVMDCLGRRVL